MNLASTLRVCLHFDGKNEARDPRASFSPCAQIHKSENIISVSFTPFTWGNKYKTHKSKQKYKKPKTIYSQLMNCSYRCVCAHHCVQLHVVHNTTQNSSYCVDTFADSEPYCHSVCLSGCLSVIPRPTAYHDWSITTKVCRTRVSLFGSPISHTFGATAKNSPDRGLRSSHQLDPDLVESHIVVNDSSTSNIRSSYIEIGRSRFLANFEVTWLDN